MLIGYNDRGLSSLDMNFEGRCTGKCTNGVQNAMLCIKKGDGALFLHMFKNGRPPHWQDG